MKPQGNEWGLVHRHGKPQRRRPLEPDITGPAGEAGARFPLCKVEATPGLSIGSSGGAQLQRGTVQLLVFLARKEVSRGSASGAGALGPCQREAQWLRREGAGGLLGSRADRQKALCQRKASREASLLPRLGALLTEAQGRPARGSGPGRSWQKPPLSRTRWQFCRVALQGRVIGARWLCRGVDTHASLHFQLLSNYN